MLTPAKYLGPDELKLFRKCLDDTASLALAKKSKTRYKDTVILSTILGAGLRVSEVTHLKLEDVFIGYGDSHIQILNSKGGKSRMVKIGTDLKRKLKDYLKWKRSIKEEIFSSSHLFLSERKAPYTTRAIQKRFKLYLKKAGIHKTCGIHSLRHTFALMLYKASGHNLRMVQKQLGHSSVQTTQIYADVLDEDTEQAVNQMFNIPAPSKKKAWQMDAEEVKA